LHEKSTLKARKLAQERGLQVQEQVSAVSPKRLTFHGRNNTQKITRWASTAQSERLCVCSDPRGSSASR
jgi:hypothetical protein